MIALLALPWVRKVLEAALILGAISAIAYSLYEKGVNAGQRAEATSQVQTTKAEFERIESTVQQQLSAQGAAVEQYRQLVVTLIEKAGNSGRQAQAAATAGTADQKKLAAVTDSQIQQDLEAKLGGPLSSPAILRLDDSIVTDYPHVKAQADALVAQVTSLTGAIEGKDKQIVATEGQRDAAITAYNGLVPLYAVAYNAAVKRHRRWVCLWLCQTKALAIPAPVSIRSRQPLQP